MPQMRHGQVGLLGSIFFPLCRGRQLFFYKRAQIFVGDLWGAFRGQGLGAFSDIDQLTMFAGAMRSLQSSMPLAEGMVGYRLVTRSLQGPHPS